MMARMILQISLKHTSQHLGFFGHGNLSVMEGIGVDLRCCERHFDKLFFNKEKCIWWIWL